MHSERLNILIVEDEPFISIFIKKIVQKMGENIIGICANSDDAIASIRLKKPDVIFMDINIQGSLDGISIVRKVPMPHKPTIFFVSAYSDKETIDDALSTKPYSYLIKPITERDIEIAVSLARTHQKKVYSKDKEHLVFGDDIYYDLSYQELKIDGNLVNLSVIEKKIFDLFIVCINHHVSIKEIKDSVWDKKDISEITLRDAIRKLRKKIAPLNIETIFGIGYMLKK